MKKEQVQLLLELQGFFASLKSKHELFKALHSKLKSHFYFDDAVIARINYDNTHSAFLLEVSETTRSQNSFQPTLDKKFSLDDGLVGRMMRADHPVIYHIEKEMEKLPELGYLSHLHNSGIRCMLGVVLKLEGKPIGFFYLQSKKPYSFDKNDVQLLNNFKGIVAIGFQNILHEEEILSRQKEAKFQLEVNHTLMKEKTIADLTASLAKKLNTMIPIDTLSIRFISNDGYKRYELFEKFDETNFADAKNKLNLDAAQLKAYALEEMQSELSRKAVYGHRDIRELARRYNIIRYKTAYLGINNLLQHPLPTLNENVGLISLGRKTGGPFTHNDLMLVGKICYQISLALENLGAFEEIKKLSEKLEKENAYLSDEINSEYNFKEIVGKSPAIHDAFLKVSQVAPTNTTVLVTGESGTGKELVVRSIHDLSKRASKPLIKVNCATLPDQLIESELFGHERGSFTGALEKRIGKFELADGGTIFLDEIGELPLGLQAKLLRVLQEREFERLGGNKTIKVDVRIIAATNRNLKAEVDNHNFRADLFYRLNVFPIAISPLRENKEDIPLLVNHFIRKFNKKLGKHVHSIYEKSLQKLMAYDWPGNIRELEHVIERSVIRARAKIIDVELPFPAKNFTTQKGYKTLEELQRDHILDVLKHSGGRIRGKNGAAEILDIKPTTLEARMKKLGIKREYVG